MDDKDRHHLPDDRNPAKLDQEQQVLLVGYVINGNRQVPLFDELRSVFLQRKRISTSAAKVEAAAAL
jgi:hypothetical protein